MSKMKEEKERLEREKRLIREEREKYVGKESDDEEWEKLEVYIGRIEKCLEDEMWDEIYKPEEGEDAEKMEGRGKKRSREELIFSHYFTKIISLLGKSMIQYEAIWCNNLFSRSFFNFQKLLVRPWEYHMPFVQCLLLCPRQTHIFLDFY